MFVLAPLLMVNQTGGGKGKRVPAGQFSADVRTGIAVMRYLIEPDSDGRAPGILAVDTLRDPAFRAVVQPSVTMSCPSNQMELRERFTNQPARS
jgi:hypothetical protein